MGQPNSYANVTATDRLKQIWKKYDGILENPRSENSNPVIASINQKMGVWSRAHYCGSALYVFGKEAGFNWDIPKSQAPRAANWKNYGEVVWNKFSGWKPNATKIPAWDEVYILFFNWNGQNHVGVALEFHGGINFITGEGNTSGIGVRILTEATTNYVDKPKSKRIYISNSQSEGIWMRKERYQTSALVAIIKYKVL